MRTRRTAIGSLHTSSHRMYAMMLYPLMLVVVFSGTVHLAWADAATPFVSESTDKSLHQVLEDLGKRYEIFLSYNTAIVEDVHVDFEFRSNEDVEDAVARLLEGTGLRCKSFKGRYFVIYGSSRKQKSQAKRVIKKFQSIDKIEQKSTLSVHKRDVGLSVPGASTMVRRRITLDLDLIEGEVKGQDGQPLIGVNVVVKGTSRGTATDLDGRFSIMAEIGEVLVCSYTGYQDAEVEIKGKSSLKILLVAGSTLDEVIVVGYAKQKKITVSGSVASMQGEELKETRTANLVNGLAGRVSGLSVNSRGGEPGREINNILIRGLGTTGNNTPLIVIDGIANRDGFERLNPQDIASISVLKDASAAIYGAQAANGVILITTKRGAQGKPVLNYRFDYSLSQPTRRPYLMNARQYYTYLDERNERNGRPSEYREIIKQYEEGTIDQAKWADTDWWGAIMDEWTPQAQHAASLSGGNDDVKYFLSGQYLNQDATYIGDAFGYKQYNVRANVDAQITSNLTLGFDLSGRVGDRRSANRGTQGLIRQVFVQPPSDAPYYPNGLAVKTPLGNPINLVNGNAGSRREQSKKADTKFSFKVEMPYLMQGLYASGYAAFDYYTTVRKNLAKPYDQYLLDQSTGEYVNLRHQTGAVNLFQQIDEQLSRTYHLRLGFHRRFEAHEISSFIAYEQNDFESEFVSASRRELVSPSLPYLFSGSDATKSNDGRGFQSARQNIFGRINYNFREKYLLEFTMRYDGSQNFAKGHRFGLFPGISVGWRLSEEKFMANAEVLTGLKLRASWGKLGNDKVDNFQYLQFYNLTDSYILGNGTRTTGLTPGETPNPNITWETAVKSNLGIDFEIRDGLLSGAVDLFHEKRSDILAPRNASVPLFAGINLPDENIGRVSNQGIELDLQHRSRIGSMAYQVGAQLSYARSKIIYIDEPPNIPEWQRRTGRPIDFLLVWEADGLYQDWEEINASGHFPDAKPGAVRFVDQNDDGVIDVDDRIILKHSPTPKMTYGFSASAKWRNLRVSTFFQGQAMSQTVYRPWDLNQQSAYFTGRWVSKRTTPDAEYPASYDMSSSTIQKVSTIWVKDNAFLKLKNVEVSYALSNGTLTKWGINDLSFFASGHNLWIIYDHVGINDPESTSATSWYYPQQKLVTAGVSITF